MVLKPDHGLVDFQDEDRGNNWRRKVNGGKPTSFTGYRERPMEQAIVTEMGRHDPYFNVEGWLPLSTA